MDWRGHGLKRMMEELKEECASQVVKELNLRCVGLALQMV